MPSWKRFARHDFSTHQTNKAHCIRVHWWSPWIVAEYSGDLPALSRLFLWQWSCLTKQKHCYLMYLHKSHSWVLWMNSITNIPSCCCLRQSIIVSLGLLLLPLNFPVMTMFSCGHRSVSVCLHCSTFINFSPAIINYHWLSRIVAPFSWLTVSLSSSS